MKTSPLFCVFTVNSLKLMHQTVLAGHVACGAEEVVKASHAPPDATCQTLDLAPLTCYDCMLDTCIIDNILFYYESKFHSVFSFISTP